MLKGTVILPLFLSLIPLPVGASITDSEQVLKLFSDAKTEALVLQKDGAELNTFAQSGVSWQSYADQLAQIKTHVNNVINIVQELNDLRIVASPWQQIAIARVNPLLKELARNTELTITKLNSHPGRVHMTPYKEYVAAHFDLATDLASMVGDFVEYGKTKAKFEGLARKLELPEQ
jgi:hypothetical protein